jgi:hypothetical protein
MHESDRTIESALGIFVGAVALGVIAGILSVTGQSILYWLIRDRGWSLQQTSAFGALWSASAAFGAASSWGMIIGLVRLVRTLAGGRAHSLARASLFAHVAWVTLAMGWHAVWPALVARRGSIEDLQLILMIASAAQLGLGLLASGLWLAALVVLARPTAEGSWAGRAVAAGLVLVLDAGWNVFGYGRLMAWPALGLILGIAVAVIQMVGLYALVLPVRRAWRATLTRTGAAFDGPYRHGGVPLGAWRSASELRLAGQGIDEVRGRLRTLTIITLVATPATMLTAASDSLALAYALVVVASIQLVVAIPLVRGVARYTRAPHELPGRALGIGALLCLTGALVTTARNLAGIIAVLLGWDAGVPMLGQEGLGGAAAVYLGNVLLIASLGRAARALGEREVARRAWIVLTLHLVALVLTVLAIDHALENLERSLAMIPSLIACAFLATLILMGAYLWLLGAAARMPAFAPTESTSNAT